MKVRILILFAFCLTLTMLTQACCWFHIKKSIKLSR